MKNSLSALILFFLLIVQFSCSELPENDTVKERPDEIVTSVVATDVLEELDSIFPEKIDFTAVHPELFSEEAQKNIVLSSESEVYLTFVSEGAGYRNSLGYYIYTPENQNLQKSELELNILFPNVSDNVLEQGDMLKLDDGPFPAGTVIGFFLIVEGWSNQKVNFDREIFYTHKNLNLEKQQQHVLFQFEELGEVILAFEDRLTSGTGDADFNDIVFTVTDNNEALPISNFDLDKVIKY